MSDALNTSADTPSAVTSADATRNKPSGTSHNPQSRESHKAISAEQKRVVDAEISTLNLTLNAVREEAARSELDDDDDLIDIGHR